MTKITIEGHITTLTPFHMAHANVEGEVDPRNGRPSRKRATGGSTLPCVLTYKIPVPLTAKESVGDEDRKRFTAEIPVLPGSSLRGKIRRNAAALIKEHFVASGQRMSREAYHVLQVGAFAGTGIGVSGVRPAQLSAASEHLFAGVFGGGPALFRSTLRTHDCFAHCSEAQAVSLNRMIASPAILDAYMTTFAHSYIRRDDMLQFLDPIAPHVIENYTEAFAKWHMLVDENQTSRIGSRKAKDKGNVSPAAETEEKPKGKLMLKGQAAIEAVLPGVPFGFRVDVQGDDAQCGMILASIIRMFNENEFGGYIRNGYGRFSAALSMSIDGGRSTSFLNLDGSSNVEPSGVAAPYLDAFAEGLRSLTAKSFDTVYLIAADAKEAA